MTPHGSIKPAPFRTLALVGTLALGLTASGITPAHAQGVPVVDTQNIAQNIQQLRQMIEDEILQNEQLTQLREQLATLTDQLAELQRTYEALTRIAELPEIIQTEMEEELNGLLDQEFGDILATIEAIKTGDFSGLTGSGASEIETQMDRVLADLGFDEDTLSEMARSGNPGAERGQHRPRPARWSRPPPRTATRMPGNRSNASTGSSGSSTTWMS